MITNSFNNQYIPSRQALIWINFKPSTGEEIRGRHPALVLSSKEYSLITGLVIVVPITHARNNRLKDFFIPLHAKKLEGYINPLQIFSFSIRKRHVEFADEVADTQDWAQTIQTQKEILGI